LSKNDVLEEIYVQFANSSLISGSIDRVYLFYSQTGYVTNPQTAASQSFTRAEFLALPSERLTLTGLTKGTWYFSMSLGIGSGRSPIVNPDDMIVVDFTSPPNFFTLQFDAVRSVDTLSYFIMEYDTFSMDTASPVDTLVDSVVILLSTDSAMLAQQYSTNALLRYASLYKDAVRDVVGYRDITGLGEGGRYYVGVATRNKAGNWSRNVTIYRQYTILRNPLDVGLAWTPLLGDSGIVVTFLNVGGLHSSVDSVKLFFTTGSYSTNPNLPPERKYSKAELLANNVRTIGGFNPNRTYYFTVTGGNNENTTGYARIVEPDTLPNNGASIATGPWIPPQNPLTFIDTVVTDTSVSFRLSGSLPSEVESVFVYYGDSANMAVNYRTLAPWRGVPASGFSGPYTLTGLPQGTVFRFAVAVKSVEKFWSDTARVSPRIRTHYTPPVNALAMDSLRSSGNSPSTNRITVYWRWTQGALPSRVKFVYQAYNGADDIPAVHNQAGCDSSAFTPVAASGSLDITGGAAGLQSQTRYVVSGWVMGSNSVWSLTGVWDTISTPSSGDSVAPQLSFYGAGDLVLSCSQVDVRRVRVSWTLSDAAADAANAAENGRLRLGYGISTSGSDVFFNGTYNYSLFVEPALLKTLKADTLELLLSQVGKTCYYGIAPVDSMGNKARALARSVDTFATVIPAMDTSQISAVETGYMSFKVRWRPPADTNVKYLTIVATDTGFYTGAFPAEPYTDPAGTWTAAKYPVSACSTEITALHLNKKPVLVSVFASLEHGGFASAVAAVDTVYYPLDDPDMPLLRVAQVNDSTLRADFRVTDGMENSILLITRRLVPVPGNPSMFTEAAFPADASDASDPAYVNLALDTIVKGPSGWTDQVAYIRLNAASLSANRFLGTDDSVLRLKFTLSDLIADASVDTAFTASVAIDRKGPSYAAVRVDYDRSTATAACSVRTDSAGDLRRVYYGRSSSSYPDSLEYVSPGSTVGFRLTGTDSVFVKLSDSLGNAVYWSWRDFVKDSLFFGDFVGMDTSVDNGQVRVYQGELSVIGAYQDQANLWIGRSRLDHADSVALAGGGFSMYSSQKYWFYTQMMTVYVEGTTIYDRGLDLTFRFDEGATGFDPRMAVYRVVRTGPSSGALEYVGGVAGQDALGAYVKLDGFRMASLADTVTLVLALDTEAPVIDYNASGLDFVRSDTSVRLTLSVSDNTVDLDARIRIFTFDQTGLPRVILDTSTSALRGPSGPSLSCTASVMVRAGGFYSRMDSSGVFCAVYVKDRETRYFYGSDTLMHDSLAGKFKLVVNQWKMVSIPYSVSDAGSLDFLQDLRNFRGEYDPDRLRLYGEPGRGRVFRQYGPQNDAFYVQPGRSFLMVVHYDDDDTVSYGLRRAYQALPEKSSGYVFTGDSAWRLVSMPFGGRVRVSSVLQASVTARTDLSLRLFRLVGATNAFTLMAANDPLPAAGDGFLAYLFPGERLVIPVVDDPVFLPAGKGAAGRTPGFTLNLVLRERAGRGVLDNLNVMGMGAAEGLALRDLEMPGSPVRAGFAGKNGLLCVDRRAGTGGGEVFAWSAEELAGEGNEAEAELEGLSSVPAGLEVWVNDCAAGFSRDLRACKGRFAFVLKGHEKRRFEVLVGDKAFVQGRLLDAPPASFALSQNYPNPFNPVTMVSFTVPDLSGNGLLAETRLRLEIYDVRGVLVRRLLDAPAQAGYYRAPWNGRSGTGKAVSTGVYVCRMAVTDASGRKRFESVRKMLMVK